MATDLRSKSARSAYSSSFVAPVFQQGLEYRNSDFQKFNGNDLATLYRNLMNFGPVTSEFKKLKGVHLWFQ